MITRIEAYRYRCFSKIDVKLDNYQVFVGANGAGKTTFLDIPLIFADLLEAKTVGDAFTSPCRGELAARTSFPEELIFNKRGDNFTLIIEASMPVEIANKALNKLIENSSPSQEMKFRENSVLHPKVLRYEVSFQVRNINDIHVIAEYLTMFPESEKYRPSSGNGIVGSEDYSREKHIIPIIKRESRVGATAKATILPEKNLTDKQAEKEAFELSIPSNILALQNVISDPSKFAITLWFKELLLSQTCPFRPDFSKLREACSPQKKQGLESDGSNLAWKIMDLKATDQELYEEWLDLVKMALPTVKTIEAKQREDDNFAYFIVHYTNDLKVHCSGVSEGTLSIIALTILPYLNSPPQVITIEEPENGLHPKAIEIIMEALSSIRAAQVWTTSHSPIALSTVELTDLLCIMLTDEGAIVTPGNKYPRLQEWRGQPSLNSLFAGGILG